MSAVNEANDVALNVVIGDGENTVTLTVPRKWRRFKFLRNVQSGNVIGALESVFGAEQVELLDDLEVDESALKDLLESLAKALAGTDAGN